MIASTRQQQPVSHGEFQRVVALSSLYARKLGTTAAVWLCQAAYTQSKAGAGRWWFKKLLAERDGSGQMIPPERELDQSFEHETGLTRSEQLNARRDAKQLGVLKERRSTFQGRIEYLIDLDSLRRSAIKWADEERSIAHSGRQEITLMKEESSGLESEILHSSTKSKEVNKGRTGRSDSVAAQGNPIPGRQTAGSSGIKPGRKTLVEIEGVHCWTPSDQPHANTLLEKHGKEKVRAAVSELQNAGKRPLPSVVEKILSRPVQPDMVAQTTELLSKYDHDKNEKDKRRTASRAAQQLSPTDRRKLILEFNERNGSSQMSSFDSRTDEFLNPAERIEFKRWLETQFMCQDPLSNLLVQQTNPPVFHPNR